MSPIKFFSGILWHNYFVKNMHKNVISRKFTYSLLPILHKYLISHTELEEIFSMLNPGLYTIIVTLELDVYADILNV